WTQYSTTLTLLSGTTSLDVRVLLQGSGQANFDDIAVAQVILTESTAASPSVAVTLNGTDQTPTYTLPITVTDTRGTGAGWNLTITSTTFSTGGGSPHTLATTASSITGVTATCAGGTCTNPTNSITYPLTVPAGSTAPAAVKAYNAAVNTGLGT